MNESGVSYHYYKKPLKLQVALIEMHRKQNKREDCSVCLPEPAHNCSRLCPVLKNILFQGKVARMIMILKTQQEPQTRDQLSGSLSLNILKAIQKRSLSHSDGVNVETKTNDKKKDFNQYKGRIFWKQDLSKDARNVLRTKKFLHFEVCKDKMDNHWSNVEGIRTS